MEELVNGLVKELVTGRLSGVQKGLQSRREVYSRWAQNHEVYFSIRGSRLCYVYCLLRETQIQLSSAALKCLKIAFVVGQDETS